MAIDDSDIAQVQAKLTNSLKEHWKFFLIEGIILLLLGALAIVLPEVATVAVAILMGWLLLVSGVVGAIATYRVRTAPGFGWSLVSALIGIVAGIVLLVWPLSGAFSLTVILTVFLVFEGVVSILYALDHRRDATPRWSFMLVSGIVDLVLAGMIFAGLPATAAWAIGLLVGINLVFGGVALIAMALQSRPPAVR